MRLAAGRGDVNGCWDATQQLLRRLPSSQGLRLAQEFVSRRLTTFERHQPDVHWPREFIESVADAARSPDSRSWPEAESDFPGPGANSFIAAVEALWKAGHLLDDEGKRGELLADAIERAVSAERLEYWGSRHPEAWARWYQAAASGSDDVSRFEILATIKRDPDAACVEREAWLEVAQLLQEELSAAAQG
ncbi:hypothetical protein [Hyalangium gracile]|uniref:hypothetical protein n=1 Tax=Hyalangium gracile TaxID=394092 RepID=UPI001CCDB6C9|nr:hypothetical protein [Hyalangium gracile]